MYLYGVLYIPCINDGPLEEACALVIDMCAGQLERPDIFGSIIV